MATCLGRENRYVLCVPFQYLLKEQIGTAIIGLQGFFPLKGQAAAGIGSIEYPATERKRLAAL
jgi:hypothetical protein